MLKKLPHVCFVAPNAYPILAQDSANRLAGGAELQQVIVAKGLVRRGYPVSMICLDFGQPEDCEVDGIRVYRAYKPNQGLPVLRFFWPRLATIWNCLRLANADIYYQRAAGMLTGVVAAFARYNQRKSIFAVAGEPKIRFRRDRWIYEYGVRNVDCVVVQNELQQQFVRKKFGRDAVLIPSCFEEADATNETRQGTVLWAAMIRKVKRPDLFLDLVESLPEVRFTMVGGANKEEWGLYGRVEKRAASLENLDFVGFVHSARVHEYFDRADLFVNTSESEGFPNTFLQSWSRGVPTVSFVDCGARRNGQPIGKTVSSTSEMIESIRLLMRNDDLRFRVGLECKQFAIDNHSESRVLNIYEKAFDGLLRAEERR